MRNRTWLPVVVSVGLAGCASEEVPDRDVVEQACVVVPDNPTCADLELGDYSFKLEPPVGGTYGLDAYLGGTNTVTVATDGVFLDWSATIGVDAVIVKGGPDANVYYLDPEQSSGTGYSSPINPSDGQPFAISHIDFCFDYELAVSKTAEPSLSRTHAWQIDKTSPVTAAVLAPAETLTVPYTVAVDRTGHVDADWRITGVITIVNPAPFDATIVAVRDVFAGDEVALTCGFAMPFVLGPGGSVTCTYDHPLAAPVDGMNGAMAYTTGVVGPGNTNAVVDFELAAIDERDACVEVFDDRAGALGTTCASTSFTYDLELGPYGACDVTDSYVNVATFIGVDTGATAFDSWTVAVTVPPCDVGCTLTPGYWKTHSAYGPARADATWTLLPQGPDTPFFLSGASYYRVLWTPNAGNAYYTLARAYIAAELNQLAGASDTAIAATFADARTLLATYTPTEVFAWRKGSALMRRWLGAASELDRYNNGLVGPGHCSE